MLIVINLGFGVEKWVLLKKKTASNLFAATQSPPIQHDRHRCFSFTKPENQFFFVITRHSYFIDNFIQKYPFLLKNEFKLIFG